MELSQQAADSIREDQGIEVVVSDFLQYDNPESRKYDVVALRHVLEHLPDPILAMQKIAALLRDNGLANPEKQGSQGRQVPTRMAAGAR